MAGTDLTEQIRDALDGRTLACAESCTGGLVAQAFAATKGSMDWFRGGIVAYQREVKAELLGVRDAPLVSEEVAITMAAGVARLMDAAVTVSVTGAAGPEPLDGAQPGTVVVGVCVDGHARAFPHDLSGEPPEVCSRARDAALEDLLGELLTVGRA